MSTRLCSLEAMSTATITTATEAVARIEELAEAHGYSCEAYGELYAEYRGEVARFGDAWPGAALHVAGAREVIREIEAELDDLEARFPIHGPEVPPVPFVPTDEEPF